MAKKEHPGTETLRLYVTVLTLLDDGASGNDARIRIRKIMASKAFREYVSDTLRPAGYEKVISMSPGAHDPSTNSIALDLTVAGDGVMQTPLESDLESWLRRMSQAGGFECGRKLRVACDPSNVGRTRTVLVPAGARIEKRFVSTRVRIHERNIFRRMFAPARYREERVLIERWNGMRVWRDQSEFMFMLSSKSKSPYAGWSGSICEP